jgi:iron complex outermembrane receptor protein
MSNLIFRKTLLSAAMVSVFSHCQWAQAAESDEQSQSETEVIAITGSRIKRQTETTSPVQELDLEALNQTGSMSLGEVLQELPSVGSSLNGNGSGGTSHGTSSLNLRNLGANRSLVLVNGQRWVNGAGTRGFRDFVDMNTIPQAIVSRVEVLQDGATAIYGADAIAGVVNIYTHSDYVGTRIKTYYGESSEGDRETANIDMLWGKDVGESNFMFAASYTDQKPVYTQDRELTAVPLNGLTGYTPEGFFRENDLATLGLGFDGSDITRDFGSDGEDLNNWRDPTDADEYNRYHNNYVVGPSERTALYGQALIPFGEINFRIEALYNKRVSDQQFSQVLSSVRGSRGFAIANDPAVNPFGVEFSGSDFRLSSFMTDNDYRVNEQNVETTRLGIGADGELSDDWSWDGYLSWAQNKGEFTSYNQLHLDKLALGLLNCDTSGINVDVSDLEAGCVGVNLFNPLTDAMVNYINFTGHDKNKASQIDFTLNATGNLIELPAGDLAMAFGIEYRKEKGDDVSDSVISSTPRINSYRTTSSSPRLGTNGEYDLKEAYAEFSIPLLEGKTFAEYLELSLATRFSDYSTFGSTTNSKAGLLFTPVEGLSFRATWAEGFRAPSILELFEGQRVTFSPVSDPCATDNTLPGCSGVPVDFEQTDSNIQLTTGGNSYLQPETSENTSVGVIFIPTFMDNFSLTIDWYDIDINNTISEFGAQNILELCAFQNRNCEVISRNSLGEIENIIDGPVNLNSTSVSGMDVFMRYAIDNQSGQWDFTANFSKLNELTEASTLSDGSTQEEDLVGTAASRESYPEWRGAISANWKQNDWFAAYSARYIGDTTEKVINQPRSISSVTTHNISAGYHFDDRLTVKLGINNIADTQPPSSITNTNINFDQNTYNPVGRFTYMQASYEF